MTDLASFATAAQYVLSLALGGDKVASVYAEDLQTLNMALVERMAALGTATAGDLVPFLREMLNPERWRDEFEAKNIR